MITPEIFDYIKSERAKNTPDEEIKKKLTGNGWKDSDIAEAMSPSAVAVSKEELNKIKNKLLGQTFVILLGIDLLLIVLFKVFRGTYGLFGISPMSILVRIVVILLIALFSVQGSTKNPTPGKITLNIFRIIGTILVAILLALGIFFIYCLILVSSYHS